MSDATTEAARRFCEQLIAPGAEVFFDLPGRGKLSGDAAAAAEAGWIVVWRARGKRLATLTPYAAERLKVEIDEPYDEGEPFWRSRAAKPRPIKLPHDRRRISSNILDGLEIFGRHEWLYDDESGERVTLWGRPVRLADF